MEGNNEVHKDSEIYPTIFKILVLVVTPTVSALGIVGNCFGVIVLLKQGLRKSSNILLVVLALSDIVFLVSFNGERLILYHLIDLQTFRELSDQTCGDVMVIFYICFYFDYSSGTISSTLPTLVTMERLVAVFFPLDFHRIVTTRRPWLIVSFMCLTWLAFLIYPSFFLRLRIVYSINNISTAIIDHQYRTGSNSALEILEHFLLYSAMTLSPILTALGCLIISLKLRFETAKRKKMTAREISSNRTTLMLLAVCVMYVVTCAIMSLPIYLPNDIVSTAFTDGNPSNQSKVIHQTTNIIACINCSCNFVVYVCTNRKFRDDYIDIFCNLKNKRGWRSG